MFIHKKMKMEWSNLIYATNQFSLSLIFFNLLNKYLFSANKNEKIMQKGLREKQVNWTWKK